MLTSSMRYAKTGFIAIFAVWMLVSTVHLSFLIYGSLNDEIHSYTVDDRTCVAVHVSGRLGTTCFKTTGAN